ncbi:MAG: hypothetical protein ACE5HV_08090 [Acidobacteriota bacterium]
MTATALVVATSSFGGQAAETLDAALVGGLQWRPIGPAVTGGRIDDIEVHAGDPATIYVGTASGGLWVSRNNGITWTPLFDDQPTSTIGDVAIAPSDAHVIWVGTGEANNRQSSTWGDGVYRSRDGGESWQHLGLDETHHIGRLVVHPSDPDTAYVAAVGHLWGPNPERGVYKTTDGGASWQQVLRIDDDTGVIDLAMDAADPSILYAAAYQRRRRAWGFAGGGLGSGIYRSMDAGASWTKLSDPALNNGLPTGNTGRIGLAVSASRPEVVMAIIQHADGGVYRSEDRGESWKRVNSLDPRPMYYSNLRIDPTSDQVVYVVATESYVSMDGGESFERLPTRQTYDIGVHSDHHALWIDPAEPKHLLLGGDGGLYDSYDRGHSWRKINNFAIGQFYGIGVDSRDPYWIYGGMQDNHSWRGPSATRRYAGIINDDWQQTDFGDGMYAQPDPDDPDTVYIDSNDGNIIRFDARTGNRKSIRPLPPTQADGEPERYRFDWNSPIHISPHDSNTIYFGGNRLFISHDRGDSWQRTPDLAGNPDRDAIPIMGIVADEQTLSRNDGTGSYGEITTISESPLRAGVLWVGTDNGVVRVSRDGGAGWTDVSANISGVPPGTYVSRVLASRRTASTAYVTFDAHRDDDFGAYIFRTEDFGQSWTSVVNDLPADAVNVIIEHPRNPDLLFVGTEHGVFCSLDASMHWLPLRNNLPTVPVDDMLIQPRENDLVIGTHGRSIWILDQITALERLLPPVRDEALHAFPVRPARYFYYWKDTSYRAHAAYAAPNPPFGAIIDYWVEPELAASLEAAAPVEEASTNAAPAGEDATDDSPARVSILDASGQVVRTLAAPAQPGINRLLWDLRVDGAESDPGRPAPAGPFVLPGRYTVRVSAGDASSTTTVTVSHDPLLALSEADLEARFDFLLALRDDQSTAYRGSSVIGEIRAQLQQRRKEGSGEQTPKALRQELDSVAEQLQALLGRQNRGFGGFGGRQGRGFGALQGRLRRLVGSFEGVGVRPGTLTPPTADQRRQKARLEAQLEALSSRLQALIEDRLPGLNQQLQSAGLEPIKVPEASRRIFNTFSSATVAGVDLAGSVWLYFG